MAVNPRQGNNHVRLNLARCATASLEGAGNLRQGGRDSFPHAERDSRTHPPPDGSRPLAERWFRRVSTVLSERP
jgi:hypothetical protein